MKFVETSRKERRLRTNPNSRYSQLLITGIIVDVNDLAMGRYKISDTLYGSPCRHYNVTVIIGEDIMDYYINEEDKCDSDEYKISVTGIWTSFTNVDPIYPQIKKYFHDIGYDIECLEVVGRK